ncbi:hypothetical protein BJ741DRAFT_150823 [Chytriomyces cf. hyalinus JEL632]|nr:hypothetical protein BJ741DRAFT_150823 [Chytriomyces cf. hyalinus JEL632]
MWWKIRDNLTETWKEEDQQQSKSAEKVRPTSIVNLNVENKQQESPNQFFQTPQHTVEQANTSHQWQHNNPSTTTSEGQGYSGPSASHHQHHHTGSMQQVHPGHIDQFSNDPSQQHSGSTGHAAGSANHYVQSNSNHGNSHSGCQSNTSHGRHNSGWTQNSGNHPAGHSSQQEHGHGQNWNSGNQPHQHFESHDQNHHHHRSDASHHSHHHQYKGPDQHSQLMRERNNHQYQHQHPHQQWNQYSNHHQECHHKHNNHVSTFHDILDYPRHSHHQNAAPVPYYTEQTPIQVLHTYDNWFQNGPVDSSNDREQHGGLQHLAVKAPVVEPELKQDLGLAIDFNFGQEVADTQWIHSNQVDRDDDQESEDFLQITSFDRKPDDVSFDFNSLRYEWPSEDLPLSRKSSRLSLSSMRQPTQVFYVVVPKDADMFDAMLGEGSRGCSRELARVDRSGVPTILRQRFGKVGQSVELVATNVRLHIISLTVFDDETLADDVSLSIDVVTLPPSVSRTTVAVKKGGPGPGLLRVKTSVSRLVDSSASSSACESDLDIHTAVDSGTHAASSSVEQDVSAKTEEKEDKLSSSAVAVPKAKSISKGKKALRAKNSFIIPTREQLRGWGEDDE